MISLTDLDRELVRRGVKALEEPEPPVVRLATRLEPRFRDGFIQAFEALREAVDVDALAEALLSGRMTTAALDAALARLPQTLRDAWRPLLQQAFMVGATDALATLTVDFALVNPLAVEWAARQAAQLVTEIDDATRTRIQVLTTEAIAGRADVRETARRLRDVVGLRQDQVDTLTRRIAEWRDRGIAGELLDARARRLSAALLRQRAILIARTEILSAANAGQWEAWRVATRQGLLDPKAWRRVWIATHDDRLEPVCFELDGTTAPLLEGEFPGGYARPPAHPNCRCSMRLTQVRV